MAEQKPRSQAEKAASTKKTVKKTGGKPAAAKNSARTTKNEVEERAIPFRFITSAVCLGLFILFFVIFLNPDGALVKLFQGVVLGLIGNVSFYVAIPGLLYLFSIHAFSGKRPILLRSICLISFILICGCISQLGCELEEGVTGFSLIGALYKGGAQGTSAGLLCGGIGLMLSWLCGTILSYIILILAAVFTLLGAFQITIPSIIRAVQNRPRAEWEDEEREEVPEPAAVVVNHLANKRIEYVENKRRLQAERAERAEIDIPVDDTPADVAVSKSKPSRKASELLSQIDSDVEKPVAAAQQPVQDDTDELIASDRDVQPEPQPANVAVLEDVPAEMPAFQKEEPEPIRQPVAVEEPVKPQGKLTAKDTQESAAEVAAEIAKTVAEIKMEYHYPHRPAAKPVPQHYGRYNGNAGKHPPPQRNTCQL